MELGHVLRAARQQCGWSQRDLAAAAGVHRGVVERAEAGRSSPSWDVVMRLLDAAGRDVTLSRQVQEVDERTSSYLRLSTGQRLHWSIGARGTAKADNAHPVWMALRRAATGRTVVLGAAASRGVWLPDVPAPVPLPVFVIGRPLEEPDLQVVHAPLAVAGLVPVGVSVRWEVLVHPPDHPDLTGDAEHGDRLRAVGALLDAEQRRDAARRRLAPHRDSDVLRERAVVVTTKAWKKVPADDPDLRFRRDWCLGGEASFREWLVRRRFPLPEPPEAEDPG